MSWLKWVAAPIANAILGVSDAGTKDEDQWAEQRSRESAEREHHRIVEQQQEAQHQAPFDSLPHDDAYGGHHEDGGK